MNSKPESEPPAIASDTKTALTMKGREEGKTFCNVILLNMTLTVTFLGTTYPARPYILCVCRVRREWEGIYI